MTFSLSRSARLMGACMILLLSELLAGCSGEEAPAEEVIRPVRTQLVFATGGTRQRTFSGTARANVESQLSFKVAGLVEEVGVELGEAVKQGQLIARLDPTDYELQVQDAEALLAQAQSQARNARANYDRMQALYENNNASRSDLDAALATKESADAQVESARKKLELTRLQLRYTQLLAPFDGSIASVDVEINENVSAGKRVVMLTGEGVPEVEVSIPEILISFVHERDPAVVTFDAIPGETFPAHATEVATASAGFATTYPVKLRLDQRNDRVRPGMAAEVTFTFRSQSNRESYLVPAVAVAEDNHGRFVFVIEDGDEGLVARRRTVEVGELTRDGLEITDGLSDGERVVTAGVSRISDGQRVRVETGEPAR